MKNNLEQLKGKRDKLVRQINDIKQVMMQDLINLTQIILILDGLEPRKIQKNGSEEIGMENKEK